MQWRKTMLEFGFKSDTGCVRESNQDSFFVMPDAGLFMVADGVGGNSNGELASRTVMADIAASVREHPILSDAGEDEIRDYFIRLITSVNQHLFDLSGHNTTDGMATTLVVLYVIGNKAYVMNIGDSRLYLIRHNKIMQVTEDHTYVNDLLKQGIIDVEQARNHPDRNMITRAVGAESRIQPDLFMFELAEGDILASCTDGLYNEMTDEEIKNMILESSDMRIACSRLVDEANTRGGKDNITVVCVKI